MIFNRVVRRKKEEGMNLLRKMSEKYREETIKKIVEEKVDEAIKRLHVKEKLDMIFKRLNEMEFMIEEIKNPGGRKKESSVRKEKIKGMIKMLLKQHGPLSAIELGKLLNLSRSRCSEYLNELEKEGIVKGNLRKRRKYYEILD